MLSKIFGSRLKEARKANGLSLDSLSDRVDLSVCAIKKYEEGEFPSSDILIKLCKELKIPVECLFRPEIIKIKKNKSY